MKRNVYDFDKTIYAGDATAHFHRQCFFKYPRVALDIFGAGAYFTCMRLGLVTKTRAKERFYRFLTYVPDVENEVLLFWAKNAHRIKRWYLECRRDDDLIISASPEFLLAPVCAGLAVQLIASRVDPLSGSALSPNCHGPEKVIRMRAACPDTEILSFYSDSRSDAPLAALAEQSFLVRGERRIPW